MNCREVNIQSTQYFINTIQQHVTNHLLNRFRLAVMLANLCNALKIKCDNVWSRCNFLACLWWFISGCCCFFFWPKPEILPGYNHPFNHSAAARSHRMHMLYFFHIFIAIKQEIIFNRDLWGSLIIFEKQCDAPATNERFVSKLRS